MSSFARFAAQVNAQFKIMSKGELFTTSISDLVWDTYLASFPEGTNPIFRERTEHDCSCCRQFIKNISNVVSIVDGQLISVWDIKGAEHPYSVVAEALSVMVKAEPISGLYRVSETSFGKVSTKELMSDAKVKTWYHFHGDIADRHFTKEVGSVKGSYATTAQVFLRGLTELKPECLVEVIGLIGSNEIYRGTEFLPALKAFKKMQDDFLKIPESSKEERVSFAWIYAGNPASRFRNSAIGTLIQDLSEGKETSGAVAAFEFKMDGYKRPTAMITPAMIKTAMATIKELDLEQALERRFAKISDISINNVLWADGSVKDLMKGNLETLLMGAVTAPVRDLTSRAVDISIEDFMVTVAPQATSMDLLLKNSMQPNLMSLTAPVHGGGDKLFKWDNDFAWSYSGNITDSLRQKVANLGGRVDGVLRFTHTWNHVGRNASLMDLHVFMPGSGAHTDGRHDSYPVGQRVGWNCLKDTPSQGVQDVDYTTAAPVGYVPVENITFPKMNLLKDGAYTFKIHNWALRAPTDSGFKAEIEFDGQIFQYDHPQPLKQKEWITLAVATLKKGVFTIEHHHPVGVSSQEVWGVQTEKLVKVNTLMQSPNHWDNNAVGNKHWFFVLDGCKTDVPARGIYNEFLTSGLEKHRKVFETLGNRTQCQPTDDQLSGVGFSSTRKDSVLVNVTGAKKRGTFNVTF